MYKIIIIDDEEKIAEGAGIYPGASGRCISQ